MENTEQTALADFEKAWVTLQWEEMTDARRNIYLRDHLGLQIAAAKEIEANRLEAEQQAETQAQERKQQLINLFAEAGFACDNSKADWDKLYNRPEIFGANWQLQSDYQQSVSTGLDYFLNTAQGLW